MSAHLLEPASLFGKFGHSFDYPLDECKLVVMPYSLESQRRARRCQVYEHDAAWRRFHHGGVDQRHAASPRQVAPDRVARGLFIDPGLEAGSAAVTDDGVEQARGHFAGPDLKQPVGGRCEFDSLAPCEPVCFAEGNSQGLAPHYSRVEARGYEVLGAIARSKRSDKRSSSTSTCAVSSWCVSSEETVPSTL